MDAGVKLDDPQREPLTIMPLLERWSVTVTFECMTFKILRVPIFGLAVNSTFDLMTSKSNQFTLTAPKL